MTIEERIAADRLRALLVALRQAAEACHTAGCTGIAVRAGLDDAKRSLERVLACIEGTA